MPKTTRLRVCHEPTLCQPYGWSLGKTNPNNQKCVNMHPGSVIPNTWQFILKNLPIRSDGNRNSRPITAHLLNDPTGPQPLTPNLLLTMKSSIILPPPGDFVKEDLYLRRRWRRVQYLANEFWQRWKKEYLLNLQQRQKWHKTNRNAKVNDIVIIQDDTTPRNDWRLAKVTAVYPSQDGCVRKVQLLISDS